MVDRTIEKKVARFPVRWLRNPLARAMSYPVHVLWGIARTAPVPDLRPVSACAEQSLTKRLSMSDAGRV